MAKWKTSGIQNKKLKTLIGRGVSVSQILVSIDQYEFNFNSQDVLDELYADLLEFKANNSDDITPQEHGSISNFIGSLVKAKPQSNTAPKKPVLPKPKPQKPVTKKTEKKPEPVLPKVVAPKEPVKKVVVKKPTTKVTKVPTVKKPAGKLVKAQEKTKVVAENKVSGNSDLASAILALTKQVGELSSRIDSGSVKKEKRTAEQIHQERMASLELKKQKEDRLAEKVKSDAAHKRDLEESTRKKIEMQSRNIAQRAHSEIEKTKRNEMITTASNKRTLAERYKAKRMYDYLATPEGQKAERYKGQTQRKEISAKLAASEHRLEQAQIRKNVALAQLARRDSELAFKKQRNEERKQEKKERETKQQELRQKRESLRLQKEAEAKRKSRNDAIVSAFGKEDAVFGATARGALWLHDKMRSRNTNADIQKEHTSNSLVDGMIGGATGNILARGIAALLPAVITFGGAAMIGTIVGAVGAYIWNNKGSLFENKNEKSNLTPENKQKAISSMGFGDSPFGSNTTPSDLKSGMKSYSSKSEGFYNEIYNKALTQAKGRGIKNAEVVAHLAASQASLESNYGKKHSGKNNIFGIKGKGKSVKTKEFINGKMVSTKDNFADYNSIDSSISGYLDLIQRKRYSSVLNSTHVHGAADAIRSSGYATDPNYSKKLKQIYNANKLFTSQNMLDSSATAKAGAPVSVNIVGGGSGGSTVNNSTTVIHAPDTDPTIRKIGERHLMTNRIQ